MTANNPVEGYENLADRNSQPWSANGANPKRIMDFQAANRKAGRSMCNFQGSLYDTNTNKCTTMARSFKITIHLYVLIPANIWAS